MNQDQEKLQASNLLTSISRPQHIPHSSRHALALRTIWTGNQFRSVSQSPQIQDPSSHQRHQICPLAHAPDAKRKFPPGSVLINRRRRLPDLVKNCGCHFTVDPGSMLCNSYRFLVGVYHTLSKQRDSDGEPETAHAIGGRPNQGALNCKFIYLPYMR